jgi:hypothetical protein
MLTGLSGMKIKNSRGTLMSSLMVNIPYGIGSMNFTVIALSQR